MESEQGWANDPYSCLKFVFPILVRVSHYLWRVHLAWMIFLISSPNSLCRPLSLSSVRSSGRQTWTWHLIRKLFWYRRCHTERENLISLRSQMSRLDSDLWYHKQRTSCVCTCICELLYCAHAKLIRQNLAVHGIIKASTQGSVKILQVVT